MISTVDRLRLAALLGMLGSAHVGERENAAQLVEQFRRQRGLNWVNVLARRPLDEDLNVRAAYQSRWAAAGWNGIPLYSTPRRSRGETVWRWLMLLAIVTIGLMSLTLLARQHAIEKLIAVDPAGRCAPGMTATDRGGCVPMASNQHLTGLPATHPAADNATPKEFTQGLADRKVYETWRKLAPPGLYSGRGGGGRGGGGRGGGGQNKWASDCAIARELLTQFEQRRRADPVHQAGWNSLVP
jgi:hypothetical protein